MTTDVRLRSESEVWGTPDPLFGHITDHWGVFDLDPCADDYNTKACAYYTEEDNGLLQPWYGNVFVNPPFNRKKKMYVGPWVAKACLEAWEGRAQLVVMLIPAKTDTKWWQHIVMNYAEHVYLIEGRVKFVQEGKDNAATFPSALVVFRGQHNSIPKFDKWPRHLVH